MARGEGYKYIQFRLPTPLYEQFYKAFPGYGERSRVLERFVVHVLEGERSRSELLREILAEAED